MANYPMTKLDENWHYWLASTAIFRAHARREMSRVDALSAMKRCIDIIGSSNPRLIAQIMQLRRRVDESTVGKPDTPPFTVDPVGRAYDLRHYSEFLGTGDTVTCPIATTKDTRAISP